MLEVFTTYAAQYNLQSGSNWGFPPDQSATKLSCQQLLQSCELIYVVARAIYQKIEAMSTLGDQAER